MPTDSEQDSHAFKPRPILSRLFHQYYYKTILQLMKRELHLKKIILLLYWWQCPYKMGSGL